MPFSAPARARFAQFAAELALLRGHGGEPVVDLTRRVITTLGLEIELASAGSDSTQLAAFTEAVAAYADVDGDASLSGLLAYLAAERDHGVSLEQAMVTQADSVKLLTVHKAKGLEWDEVYVPGLASDVFPSLRVTDNWLRSAAALPSDLRGDADAVPQVEELSDPALSIHAARLTEQARFAEDRLAYVAATRARRTLVATTHTWGQGLLRARTASPYFAALTAIGVALHLAPPPGETNPLVIEVTPVPWPNVGDAETRERRRVAAAAVRNVLGGVVIDGEDTPGTLDEADQIAAWEATTAGLLADAAPRGAGPKALPGHLTATGLARAVRDPDAFVSEVTRPMPRLSSRAQRTGSRFHRWLERRYSLTPALDPELDLAVRDSLTDRELAALQAAFERGRFAGRSPAAIETPFTLVMDGNLIRGRIDAVFETTEGFLVVDWKTGSLSRAEPLQLAVYRIAWSEMTGTPIDLVAAAFYDVLADRLEVVEALPDRDGLVDVLAGITGTG